MWTLGALNLPVTLSFYDIVPINVAHTGSTGYAYFLYSIETLRVLVMA